MDTTGTDFDWDASGLPESWWRETGAEVRASEQQIKFACAFSLKEVSASEAAARRAGIAGAGNQLKQAAYRLSRSVAVEELLGRAKAERAGDNKDGTVDAVEARRILSRLARNSDPSVKIRAVEALLRLDEADAARAQAAERDPDEILCEIDALVPGLAAVLKGEAEVAGMSPNERDLAIARRWIAANPQAARMFIAEALRTDAPANN